MRMPRRGDLVAVGVLVGLAVLVFGLPSLLGRPVLPGDDMTQNYPLRVLAGQQIRAGHLPLFDPYIWSGAPLLGGWNGAAAYPLTWLFALLPGLAAWTVGLVATYAVAAVGMYGFLRLGPGLRPVASFLGGLTFAFGGAMAAQVTHFGVVTGMSWVPLGLLAVLKLTAAPAGAAPAAPASGADSAIPPTDPIARPARPWRDQLGSWVHGYGAWTALLGLAIGLVILAGEPRAIADGLIVVCLYAAWRLAALGRRCLPGLASVAAGVVLGAALSAVQVLPGMAAISTSQRAGASLALFSSGSLPDRWLALLLVPDLLGGSGSLSQPSFFGFYNLTEIDGYVGILPLVAALALLARVRVRPPRQLPEWLAWHATALVGAALALGGNTPLGPVLASLPFYGTQRLQSRNILVLDLALAVLLAYWADQPFPAGTRRRVSLEGTLAALPAVGVVALVTAGLAGGTWLFNWLDSQAGVSTAVIAALRPWLVPYLVLGAGALALVIAGRRLPGRLAQQLITGLVVVDVITFSVLAVVQIAPRPTATGSTAASPATSSPPGTPAAGHAAAATRAAAVPHLSARPVADLGYPGRFAIYDPGLLDTSDLSALQPPDLNSISGTPSVQGYTSIVDGQYATATGSHQATGDGQNTLAPAAVADGTLDSLSTTILLTLPQYARGDLRTVLVPPHWTLAGYDGAFAIYRNHRAAGPLTLRALPGRTTSGAMVSDVTGPAAAPVSARVSSVAGVEVVRSVADIPGWSASWQPRHGPAVRLAVQSDGVVQAVDIPPGTGTLTWSYTPPRLMAGLALSLAAAAVLLLLSLGPALRGPLTAVRRHAGRREARATQSQGPLPKLQPHDSR